MSKSSVSGPMRIIGPAERTSADSIEDRCCLERSFMQIHSRQRLIQQYKCKITFIQFARELLQSHTIFFVCFYYAQVSTATVAVVDQGPIRKLVNEVAGIFRKRVEGNAVDNNQRILLQMASQHLSTI